MNRLTTVTYSDTIIATVFYSDPSAAHESALRFETQGAYRVVVTPQNGRHRVKAWFRECPDTPECTWIDDVCADDGPIDGYDY